MSEEMALEAAEEQRMLDEVNRVAHEIEDRVREAQTSGNLLTEVEALRSLDAEADASNEMVREVLALKLSALSARLGQYADAIRYADRGTPPYEKAVDSALTESLQSSAPTPAVAAILEVASSRQVIMINEAHHDPRHRAFTIQLLEALREAGFRYFAAETLYEADTALADRGYPTAESGAYTVEPVYGSLVRTAIRLGYSVIPYEAQDADSADDRERGQAANLKSRILKADPQAKIVVHAGYGHIYKSALTGVVPMAVRFQELTGIEPFSVDQTIMTEGATRDIEHPLFRLAIDKGWVRGPTIFLRNGSAWSIAPEFHDATLFHPRTLLDQGRPTWLSLGGRRTAYPVPLTLVPDGVHALVRAWAANEPEEAIPIDQIEIQPQGTRPALFLAPGSYRLVAETADATRLGVMRTQVP